MFRYSNVIGHSVNSCLNFDYKCILQIHFYRHLYVPSHILTYVTMYKRFFLLCFLCVHVCLWERWVKAYVFISNAFATCIQILSCLLPKSNYFTKLRLELSHQPYKCSLLLQWVIQYSLLKMLLNCVSENVIKLCFCNLHSFTD